MTAYNTGGWATISPQTPRAASTPSIDPSNCAAMYGTIPTAGNTPKRHIASDIAGFMCPPLILPGRLMINKDSSTATNAPTRNNWTWICGSAREIGEGPTTNLTNVVTPKSNAEVRISSSMLLRINVPNCSCDVVLISRYQNAKQSHPRLHMPASPKTQRCLWSVSGSIGASIVASILDRAARSPTPTVDS